MSLELIEETVKHAVEEKKTKRAKEIYVSDLAKCLRFSYFNRTAKIEPGPHVLLGVDIHERINKNIAEYLNSKGWECKDEVETEVIEVNGKVVRGRADVFCSSPIRMVIELKTTSNPSGTNMLLPWYYRQLKYYASLLNAELGYLVLMSFDGEIMHIREYKFSEKDREKAKAELIERAKSLTLDEIPRPEKGKWCDICNFRKQCFNAKLV
jgi:CRISPR/Cas system-associated exonuclease Cas4 (RecB family)